VQPVQPANDNASAGCGQAALQLSVRGACLLPMSWHFDITDLPHSLKQTFRSSQVTGVSVLAT